MADPRMPRLRCLARLVGEGRYRLMNVRGMDASVRPETREFVPAEAGDTYCARRLGLPPPSGANGPRLAAALLLGACAVGALGPAGGPWIVALAWTGACVAPRYRADCAALAVGALLLAAPLLGHQGRRIEGAERLEVNVRGRVDAPLLLDDQGRVGRFDLVLEDCRPVCRVRLSSFEPQVLLAGEIWQVQARLRAPKAPQNPGMPDRELAFWRHGIEALGYVRGMQRVHGVPARNAFSTHGVDAVRATLSSRIAAVGSNGDDLLRALLLGDRAALGAGRWHQLSMAGLTHLFVVSGLHLALLASFFLVFSRVLGIERGGIPAGLWALLGAGAFAWLSGFGLPVQRALLMLVILLFAEMRARAPSGWQRLLPAAALLVAADSLAILSPGFWLSCIAVAALLGAAVEGGRFRVVATQAVLTLVLAPVLLTTFGWVPLLGPAVNVLLVPVVAGLGLPLGLLALGVEAVLPGAATPVLKPLGDMLDLAVGLTSDAGMPLALQATPLWLMPVLIALTLAVFAPVPSRMRAAALALTLVLIISPHDSPPEGDFEVHVFDVGQGLAVFVRTANRTLLFDAGGRFGPEVDAGGRIVAPALAALGTAHIDRVIISHADVDHAGGLESVRARVSAGEILRPASIPHTQARCRAPHSWRWDGVAFDVLWPDRSLAPTASRNRSSCVLRIRAASGVTAVLPGDVDHYVERRLAPEIEGAELMIAGHHGSRSSSGSAWVRHARSRHVVFAAGVPSPFRHPHPDVVERWAAVGAEQWVSGATGRLLWRSDAPGEMASWRAMRSGWWSWRSPAALQRSTDSSANESTIRRNSLTSSFLSSELRKSPIVISWP